MFDLEDEKIFILAINKITSRFVLKKKNLNSEFIDTRDVSRRVMCEHKTIIIISCYIRVTHW